MRIGLDTSALTGKHGLQHKVRGSGFYTENLKKSLVTYFPENEYVLSPHVKKTNIDIFHIPYFEPFFFTIPIIKKHPTVITIHDLTPIVFAKNFPAGIKGNIIWTIQKQLLQTTNAIITDSDCSKRDITRLAPVKPEKIFVIPLAAGEEFKKVSNEKISMIKKKYGLPNNFVLYVGDVTWNKNLPRLIRAVTTLHIPLVMVGKALIEKDFDAQNPWNQDRLLVQKQSAENTNVIQLGYVPNEDLPLLYNCATVFAMPSLYEGFGLPILEAMSCGCPVVTSRLGSIPEVVGEAAYFVDAYSEGSIAQGIKEVFEREMVRDTLSKNGLVQAKNFSWKKTAEETITVYRSVLQNAQISK